MSEFRVEYDGIVFYGKRKPTDHQDQFVLVKDGLKGWDSSVGVRREKVERLYGHGSYQTRSVFTDRAVTLEGWALAESDRSLTFMLDRLAGMRRDVSDLFVMSNGRALRARACVESVTADRSMVVDDRAKFQVQFWCPDPFKYGETHRFSARLGQRVELYHRGNTDAYVRLRFNAPSTSEQVVVSGAGRTLRMLQRLQSGSFEHDTRTGKGGTPEQNSWVFGQPLIVPAGAAHSFTVNGTGAGSVDFEVIDTYI